MTVSGSNYTISGHDAGGLQLTITSGGADTSIYVGKSLFESLNDFSRDVLASSSDLQTKITNYNDDLSEYDEDLQPSTKALSASACGMRLNSPQ